MRNILFLAIPVVVLFVFVWLAVYVYPAKPPETRRQRRINALARRLQLALVQLDSAPDFRRAATYAKHAEAVPVAFRQRQFRRFRSRMIDHFRKRLRAGTDTELLTASLAELLQHLGVSSFEAEYIRNEAIQAPGGSENFDLRLQTLQREHAHRIQTLRNMPVVEPDIQEQLLEAEQQRFRDALLDASTGASGTGANY